MFPLSNTLARSSCIFYTVLLLFPLKSLFSFTLRFFSFLFYFHFISHTRWMTDVIWYGVLDHSLSLSVSFWFFHFNKMFYELCVQIVYSGDGSIVYFSVYRTLHFVWRTFDRSVNGNKVVATTKALASMATVTAVKSKQNGILNTFLFVYL